MICPKCRFSQPDDIYCALCGVNIEKFAQQKRKHRRNIGVWSAFFVLTTLAVIAFLTTPPKDDLSQMTGKGEQIGVSPLLSQETTEGNNTRPVPSLDRSRQRDRPIRQKRQNETTPIGVPPAKDTDRSLADENEEKQITARQWFEKGKRLDDDSEDEVECYLKAIELEPGFAPAAFRLAAIYFRQAKYDMADREFANFLRNATDEDQRNYNIYEYYSLADVDRLSENIALQEAEKNEQKDTGQESTSEEEEELAAEPGSEDAGQKTDEEVLTVVGFSQENGQIIVPVVLDNIVQAKVLVDTGAGITVLSMALADELGLQVETGRGVTLKTMATDVQAQLAKLDSIQVGDLKRFDFPVAIADLPVGGQSTFQGILGMDFMNHYTIHIDNEKSTISLKPRRSYRPS
jgi:predicted aspartyl protease